ncbi:MAG: MmcQ/YjbR family DNA-binding protein [Bacilli bacterium]|nr:MmcQ/YjbR family DNA-binding protein [Bacilli bacterium]
MNIEDVIFKKYSPDFDKLIKYGFKKDGDNYIFKKNLIDNFEIIITIDEFKVSGKVIDLDFDAEYTNYRVEDQAGGFTGMIREKFISVLNEIKDKCFISKPFAFDQSNRITNLIYKKYGKEPIFKWDNLDAAVFENNEKWFGIIMNVDRSKFSNLSGEIEILNVKLDRHKISNLIGKNGLYEAYHMNKKSWITIVLDDTLSDDYIMDLIDESYSYTVSILKSSEWVMPLNPSYFDIFNYFDSTDVYYWDKRGSFKKGDTIYMYVTKPIGAIMYKCMVDDITDDFMIVKKVCKYEEGKYSLGVLKKYGLTSVRSTRHIPLALKKYIEGGK